MSFLAALAAFFAVAVSAETYSWHGKQLCGMERASVCHSVREGETVRAFFRYRLLEETPGFRMDPLVTFETADGRVISSIEMGESLPDPAMPDYVDSEIYVKVPVKAVRAFFLCRFSGNPGKIEVAECIIESSALPQREKMHYEKLANPEEISDARLDEILAGREPAHATIVRHGEYNSIAVNGREITPSIWLSTGRSTPLRYSMVHACTKAGVKIVSCSAVLGVGRSIKNLTDLWLGENRYNIEPLRLELRRILKEAPDAYILLNLGISHYRGYLEAHPDEAFRSLAGEHVGFFHGYARKTGTALFSSQEKIDGLESMPFFCSDHVSKDSPLSFFSQGLRISQYWGYLEAYPDEALRSLAGEHVGFFRGYARKTGTAPFSSQEKMDGLESMPSYCSAHFAAAASRAIHDICRMISATPEGKAVIAVYLNGGIDGQWYDPFDSKLKIGGDGSPAARKSFTAFLKGKYQNDPEKMRQAWQDPQADFDRIRLPMFDELWDRKNRFHTLYRDASLLSDYCEFIGTVFAQRHILWCRAVKSGSEGRFLAGSYYNNSGLRGYPQIGHQSVRLLLNAPEVELLALVPSYQRNLRQPVHQGGFSGSLVRHGKLQITELDLRTGELPYWGRWGMPFWRVHNPAERFDIDASRFAASAIEKGGTFHIYDMEGGCFNSPRAMESWRKAIALLNERTPQSPGSDHIGVIASELFWNYQSFAKDRIGVYEVRETPLHALYRAGVKNMNYLLDDLHSADFTAPKVLIFLDAGTLTKKQAADIRNRFGNEGRVIVWLGTPGMFTSDGEKAVSTITGFKLKRAPQADGKPLFADGKSLSPIMKDVRGFLFPYTPEYGHAWGMAWEVADPDAEVLVRYYETDIPGGAVKHYADHTELYFGAPGSLTPALCRNLARLAGIHVFLDSDDFSGVNAGLLYVSALSSGLKTVVLPVGVSDIKILTGQKVEVRQGKIQLTMKTGELLILKLIRHQTPQEEVKNAES